MALTVQFIFRGHAGSKYRLLVINIQELQLLNDEFFSCWSDYYFKTFSHSIFSIITRQNGIFFFSFESNQIFLIDFDPLIMILIPDFQVPEIFLNESSKNTENALIEWLPKETTKYFPNTKVYVVSLDLSLVFKTVFGIFLAPLVYLKSVK
jgi:hypothetical protein